MSDYRKVCWYCGSKNMKAVNTWWQCNDCGATHVDIPELGPDPLANHGYYWRDDKSGVRVHSRRARPQRRPRAQAKSS